MQGTFAHGTARYRCRFPSEYALANKVEHPLIVYVKEDAIVPRLDSWIAELFNETNLDATCEAMAMAGDADDEAEARGEAARRKIADCDQRLARYRQTLDAGADVPTVAGWMAEVQGERLRAEQELGAAVPGGKLTKEEMRRLVLGYGMSRPCWPQPIRRTKSRSTPTWEFGSPMTTTGVLSASRPGRVLQRVSEGGL
jgi:hypothetical protein